MRTLAMIVAGVAGAASMLCGGEQALAQIPYPNVVYSTGFEPPTYAPGTLAGQGGWSAFRGGCGSVGSSTVFSGFQADGCNAAGASGQQLDVHAIPSSGQTSLERVTGNFYVNGTDPNVPWDALGVLGNAGFVGQLVVYNGSATIGGSASVPVTAGAWNKYQLTIDFATHTETGYVNGAPIGSIALGSPSTKLTDFFTGINTTFGTPTGQSYLDDVSVASAPVRVLYSSGFESPTYVPGTLAGQDGWSAFRGGCGSVETSTVFFGTQADGCNAAGASGQQLDVHAIPSSGQTSLERVTGNFYANGCDPNVPWDVFGALGNAGFVGQLVEYDCKATIGGSTSAPITPNAWNNYDMTINFATDTETAYVDGALIGTISLGSSSTELTDIFTGINTTFGTPAGQSYIDDLTVESVGVPEPSSLLLLVSSLAGLPVIRRRIERRRTQRQAQARTDQR